MTDGPRFPEDGLKACAESFRLLAKTLDRNGSPALDVAGALLGAKHCEDAIQAHDDTRERFLCEVAELRGELGRVKERLASYESMAKPAA